MCGDNEQDQELFGYHFGCLDEAQATAVEERLANDPEYASRYERLRRCLDAKGAASPCPDAATPTDLSRRTLDYVGSCGGAKRCTLVELGVAALAVGLLAALTLPALYASREGSRRVQCELNQAELYQAFQTHRDLRGAFPEIGPYDAAGTFSIALADSGAIPRDRLQQILVCPSSYLAEQIAAARAQVIVPTHAEYVVAPPLVRDRLLRFLAGSYDYRIGFKSGGVYVLRNCVSNCRMPLLADTPERDERGRVVRVAHGGAGQNVLFEDGHVDFLTGCWAPGLDDHFFVNDQNEIAAGCHAADIVLAPSPTMPATGGVALLQRP